MLEATMVLMDSSSWAINTDTGLTRWATQLDCAKTLFNAKTTSNPENVVGVMTMAGKGPEVLASPTQNYGAIVSALSNVRLEGEIDLITSIQVAQLALKHRQNKNLRQRIIALVGSPLDSASASDLVKLGKRLKKNNVACDIVSFGEDAENEEKLSAFVEAVSSQNNSHLVSVPAGTVLLSDMIHSSGMLSEDGVPTANGSGSGMNGGGGPGTSGTGAGGEDGEYGVDPNLDPELAMALRMSLEEERARQAASQRSQGQSQGSNSLSAIPEQPSGPSSSTGNTATGLTPELSQSAASGPAVAPAVNDPPSSQHSTNASTTHSSTTLGRPVKEEEMDQSMDGDEDADLARALALSQRQDDDEDMSDPPDTRAAGEAQGDEQEEEDISEEEAMARAIALSMQEQEEPDKPK